MTTTPTPRVPYADRPEVTREHCRCLWVYTRNPKDPQGPAEETRFKTHPECILHGDKAERSPF